MSAPLPEIEEEEIGIPEWILTFGDMMTLLLCFFILLFAMSDIKLDKLKLLVKSLETHQFGIHQVDEGGKRLGLDLLIDPGDTKPPATEVDELGGNLKPIFREEGVQNKRFIMANKLGADVSQTQDTRGAVVIVTDGIRFYPGTATLTKTSTDSVAKAAFLVNQLDYRIFVDGHVAAAESQDAPADLKLSGKRAAQVTALLIQADVDPSRIIAQGFGKTLPLDPKHDEKNGRVDIMYVRQAYNKLID